MNKQAGFTVHIYVPSGDPDGLRIIHRDNALPKGLVFPRKLFPEVRQQKDKELKQAGVYVLWGPEADATSTRVYIGESGGVLGRLESHLRSKEFWTHAAVFTSKDDSLNGAHVEYLEAALIRLAVEAGRCNLENEKNPQLPSLSESERTGVAGFLDDLLLLLPLIGADFFSPAGPGDTPEPELFLKKKRIEARGFDRAKGFVLCKGSQISKDKGHNLRGHLNIIRADLEKKGVLEDAGRTWVMSMDYTFRSPHIAAGVALGHTVNAFALWKDANGRTLKEIREAAISKRE